MRRDYSLALGGMIGSFITSCAVLAGVNRFETLIFSLFIVAVTSCIGIIVDAKTRSTHRRYSYHHEIIENLGILVRTSFGAALAAAFISAFIQSTVKVSSVFHLTLFSSGIVCTVVLTTYLTIFYYVLLIGRERIS